MEDKLKKRQRRPKNKIGAHCINPASEGSDLEDYGTSVHVLAWLLGEDRF